MKIRKNMKALHLPNMQEAVDLKDRSLAEFMFQIWFVQ